MKWKRSYLFTFTQIPIRTKETEMNVEEKQNLGLHFSYKMLLHL